MLYGLKRDVIRDDTRPGGRACRALAEMRSTGHVTAWDVRLPAATHGCKAQALDWPRQSSSSKLYLCPRSGIRPSIVRRQCRSCGSEPLRAHCSASSPASERCTSQSAVYSFGTLRVRCATHASRSAPRRADEGGLMSALRTRACSRQQACGEARTQAQAQGEAGGGGRGAARRAFRLACAARCPRS